VIIKILAIDLSLQYYVYFNHQTYNAIRKPVGKNIILHHKNRLISPTITLCLLGMGDTNMIITNIESVPGRIINQELGLVQGSTVRGKHIGRDIGAWFRGIIGGEIKGYSELLIEGRDQALERMEKDAKAKGADAVVNVRITTASVTGGAAELMAYGTAVKLAPVSDQE
jgi:uncharacterized protein YbjQ (UPF0145 family)